MNRWDGYTDTLTHSDIKKTQSFRRDKWDTTAEMSDRHKEVVDKDRQTKTTNRMNEASNRRGRSIAYDAKKEAFEKAIRDYAKQRMPIWVNGEKYFGRQKEAFAESAISSRGDMHDRIIKDIENDILFNAMPKNMSYRAKDYREVIDSIIKEVEDNVNKRAMSIHNAAQAESREHFHGGSSKENAREAEIARRRGKRW